MRRDPIVEEVRRNREAISREHGNDLEAIVTAFQQEDAASGTVTVSFPPKRVLKSAKRKSGKFRRPNTYQASPSQERRSSPGGRRQKPKRPKFQRDR